MSGPDRPPARDRAAEIITKAVEESVDESSEAMGELDVYPPHAAERAVDALLADREVLSALAGTPHPGVEEPTRVATARLYDALAVADGVDRLREHTVGMIRALSLLHLAGASAADTSAADTFARALLGHTTTPTAAEETRDA